MIFNFGGMRGAAGRGSRPLLLFVAVCFAMAVDDVAQESNPPVTAKDPVLRKRPGSQAGMAHEGRIHLDVLVTDKAGSPQEGIDPWEFKVLDNGQTRKVLSFRSVDGAPGKPEPVSELMLLIDRVNLPFQAAETVRGQVRAFLLEHDGKLPVPVSLMLLTDKGLKVQPRPSIDGKALAEVLDKMQLGVHTYTSAMGGWGGEERMKVCVQALAGNAKNEGAVRGMGRKVLLWIGPGWPPPDDQTVVYSDREQHDRLGDFDAIVSITNWLGQSRVTLYSLGGGAEFFQGKSLEAATSVEQMRKSSLALQVFAVHSGGRTLDAGNYAGLARQIDQLAAEARSYYTLSFDPPEGAKPNEYHGVRVEVSRPGLEERTTAGYYGEP